MVKRKFPRTLRLLLLSGTLSVLFVLYLYNRTHDPRLYEFLNASPGRALDGVFEMAPKPDVVGDKEVSAWTFEEKTTHQDIERAVLAEQAEDLIVCHDGRIIKGKILSESQSSVAIMQTFGAAASMRFKLKRADISRIETHAVQPVNISYRDVRFRMEFPAMKFYCRPPFTIVTTENFFDVEKAIRNLERLHSDVLNSFGPLIEQPSRGKSIQIVFFSREKQFCAYRKKHAPNLGYSAGFYSPGLDRLVLFDQTSSSEMVVAKQHLAGMRSAYMREHTSHSGRAGVYKWHQKLKQKLTRLGREETERVFRHEGAHQLFYTYGIHSEHHAENLWLLEGLATYCESSVPGTNPYHAVHELKEAHRLNDLLSWPKLVNYRSTQGFARLVRNDRVGMAYSQSWLLTHWLMQPGNRDGFFAYIRFVRDPVNARDLARMNHFDRLAAFVGMTPREIPPALEAHLLAL
ncbi:MAG: DUF1570 domain-containing protein [Verrucomicrobiota bacterium]